MHECCGVAADRSHQSTGSEHCPRCGTRGRQIPSATVRSILKPDVGAAVREEAGYRFCASPRCDVLYFDAAGWFAPKVDATGRVGLKETIDPVPLCYCFGFTRADVRAEIATTGACTIPARITAEVKAGQCACEVKNPSGACCLGDVGKAVTEALADVRGATAVTSGEAAASGNRCEADRCGAQSINGGRR